MNKTQWRSRGCMPTVTGIKSSLSNHRGGVVRALAAGADGAREDRGPRKQGLIVNLDDIIARIAPSRDGG
ncbi:MAG: hypothetical protein AAF511_11685 [Pseudomonadota bacterium]